MKKGCGQEEDSTYTGNAESVGPFLPLHWLPGYQGHAAQNPAWYTVCDVSECSLVGGEHLSIYIFKEKLMFTYAMLLTCCIAGAHELMSACCNLTF